MQTMTNESSATHAIRVLSLTASSWWWLLPPAAALFYPLAVKALYEGGKLLHRSSGPGEIASEFYSSSPTWDSVCGVCCSLTRYRHVWPTVSCGLWGVLGMAFALVITVAQLSVHGPS